jgi:hypothetical protein
MRRGNGYERCISKNLETSNCGLVRVLFHNILEGNDEYYKTPKSGQMVA